MQLEDIQGLVVRGYGRLPYASYLVLTIEGEAIRSWLKAVVEEVTPASARPEDLAVHIGWTADGLGKLGLEQSDLATFPAEFRESMRAPRRSRVLGDEGLNHPDHWDWGGTKTRLPDAGLLLYARTPEVLEAASGRLVGRWMEEGSVNAHWLPSPVPLTGEPHEHRGHFGFRDGISQPAIRGLGRPSADWNVVAEGEFVLGYPNEYGLVTERPLLPAQKDPEGYLPSATGETRDLGLNGTYLVVRQLEQDVAAFWRLLDRAAAHGGPEGSKERAELRAWLAAKMVGRWPSGHPVTRYPELPPDPSEPLGLDDFRYHEEDAEGLRCPLGAHVRRSNPRDALEPRPGTDASLAINRRHRLLRRGRIYGTPVASPEEALDGRIPEGSRGLHFICLCANLARQFEFVSQTWLNNPKFAGLYTDVDPLVGPRKLDLTQRDHSEPTQSTMTIPDDPVRRQFGLSEQVVRVRGGGYFFFPGLRALRFLSEGLAQTSTDG